MNRCNSRLRRHAVSVFSFSAMRPPPLFRALNLAAQGHARRGHGKTVQRDFYRL